MGILRKITFLFLLATIAFSQQFVGGVAFFGNSTVPDWKIKGLLRTKESPWYARLFGKAQRYDSKQLEIDLRIVRDYYVSEGFLDAKVNANAKFIEHEKKIYINVFVAEGNRYTLETLELKGSFPPAAPKEQALKILETKIGKPINPFQLQRDARSTQRFFMDRGYPYASAVSEYSKTSDSTANASISFETGKLAYFGSVEFSGLTFTKKSVLRREIAFKQGDLFSAKKVTSSREALYRTGLFSVVNVEPESIDRQPDTLNYRVTIAEKKPRWVGSSIGGGTDPEYDLTLEGGLSWGHRNLFGTGREFTIQGTSEWEIITRWANLRNRLDIKYREPWAFGTRTPITLNLYYEPGNAEKIPQYKMQLAGFDIRAEHAIGQNSNHAIYFNYERADIYDIKDRALRQQILKENGVLLSRRIGYSIVYDKRDNILVPTDGFYFSGQSELAGYFLGGDENYTKFNFVSMKYLNIRSKYVLAGRWRVSVIGNWRRGEDVLPHQLFYLGGASTIRGWQERTIGPVSRSGDPKGGKLLLLGNIEFRAPLIWQFWGHVFCDAGNLWSNAIEFNPKDIRASAGWGLALITPIGPVRFDYGYQILNKDEPQQGEDPAKVKTSTWHLSLMYAF